MSSYNSKLPHSASYPENLNKNRRDLPKQYDLGGKSKNVLRESSRSRSKSPASDRLPKKYSDDRRSSFDHRDGGRPDRLRRDARDSPSSGGGGRYRRDSPSDFTNKQRSSNGRMPSLRDLPGFVPGLFSEIDFDSLKIEERKERKASRKACLVPKKPPEEECRDSFLRAQGDSRGDRHMNEMSRHYRRGDSPIPDVNDEDSQQPQPSFAGNKRQIESCRSVNDEEPRFKRRPRDSEEDAAIDFRRPGRRHLPSDHDFDEDPYEGYYPKSPLPVEMALPDEPKLARSSHKSGAAPEPVRRSDGPKPSPAAPEAPQQQTTKVKPTQLKKDDEETEEGELSDSDDDS